MRSERTSGRILLEIRIVLGEPDIPLQHVVPIHERQASQLDPPAEPALFGWIERQGRRDLAAIAELREDHLSDRGGQRA